MKEGIKSIPSIKKFLMRYKRKDIDYKKKFNDSPPA